MDVYRIEFDSKENQVLWELLFIRTLSEESMVLYPPGKRRVSGSSTTSSARVGRKLAKMVLPSGWSVVTGNGGGRRQRRRKV